MGALVLAAMMFFFWVVGDLFPKETFGFWASPAQITGMALTYATSVAFLLASEIYLRRRTRAFMDQLVASGCVNREVANANRGGDRTPSRSHNVYATVAGLAFGALQISWDWVAESLGGPRMSMVLGIAIGNLMTWTVVAHVVMRRIRSSIQLRQLGRDDVDIDLLRIDTLLPFGRIGTLHVLIVAIAVGLSAFQSIDAELRWENYSSAFAAGIPAGLALLLLPMLGVRKAVREAKVRALARLDEAIVHASRDLEPDPLDYLGNLLHQRETVQNAREWPLDTTALSKIAIYFVIPPIAWVGGALVEILVQSAI